METVNWQAGAIVFEEGDRGDACYVVYSGQVKVMRRLVDGQPITLAQVGHGAMVGELAMFARHHRTATLQAVEPTTAIAISHEDLMEILRGNAEAAISMAVHVAGLLERAQNRAFASTTSTVNGRILATPTMTCKGRMSEELIAVTDLDGRSLNNQRASSELAMHLLIYRERPDVKAVCHAHPPDALRGHLG